MRCDETPEAPNEGGNQTEQGTEDGNNEGENTGTGGSETAGGGEKVPHTHSYGDWTPAMPATCQAEGVETRTCACGVSETQEITKGPHVYGIDNKCITCHNTWKYTEGLTYTLNGDGESYTVKKGASTLTEVVIPHYYNEKPVTSIGVYAFFGCSSLTTVTFGENSQLTSINDGAFHDCMSLTSIIIPDSVTSIDQYAFRGCTGLTSIDIPTSVTFIGDFAFYSCDSLTTVKYGGGVSEWSNIWIGSANSSLTSATLYYNCA